MTHGGLVLTRDEVERIGFAEVGEDVHVTRHALFFNPGKIRIGNRVRIDAFAILAAGPDGIEIGSNVHVASMALLQGGGGKITLSDFSGLAAKVCLWTATDDYSGGTLTNPTVPSAYKQQQEGPIRLGRHVIIGTSSVVLPGVTLGDGASVGALSLVMRDVPPEHVMFGAPARKVSTRSLEKLERAAAEYLRTLPQHGTAPE
jgi:acetyltransferase-like isoleucine patch superfamily enzyme